MLFLTPLSRGGRGGWFYVKGGRGAPFRRVGSAVRVQGRTYMRGALPGREGRIYATPPPRTDTKKGTARPLDSASPGEGGSPFFHLAIKFRLSYKESRGCPLFPFPARGLKLYSKDRYILLYHEGSNQRATPFLLSPSIASAPSPGPEASCSITYLCRRERPDEGAAASGTLLGCIKGSRDRTGSLG